jgi:Kef-type K+ transport system membrane component KefB
MLETIEGYLFYEVAALLVLAASVGFLGVLLRQPLIVSFIVVGVLAGPAVLNIARSEEPIDMLADLGIAVLLFLVGLKLDLGLIRTLGPVAVMTGLGQVIFTTVFGFLIGLALGLDTVTSLYVAVALTFSSTIIIVKLLSDKREIDSLHGRIAVGFLIVQDLVVVLAMIVLSALGVGTTASSPVADVLRILGYSALTLVGVGLFIRFLAEPLLDRLSRAPELLVSFAIGWSALLASLGHFLGFGKELGGLLAGVSLASTRYRDAIAARLASLRDFLLLFFFIALGVSLDLSLLGDSVYAALVLSLFVLIGNPVIVLIIMRTMGYDVRTGFLAGLTVAQISEFSLIFIAMGATLGHVSDEGLGLVTLVGLITIAASTYMITYSHQLYAWLEPVLKAAQPRSSKASHLGNLEAPGESFDALILGLGRYGSAIARALEASGMRVLGVDFDPYAVGFARQDNLNARFGDATDPEFLTHLPLSHTRWVICALPEQATGISQSDPRTIILRTLHDAGFSGRIAVAVHSERSMEQMRALGAHLVLMPFRDAAAQAAEMVLSGSEPAIAGTIDRRDQEELAP